MKQKKMEVFCIIIEPIQKHSCTDSKKKDMLI